jgi:hypothetical protein
LGIKVNAAMFWKKKPIDVALVPLRAELNQMAATLLAAASIDFDRSSNLDQALAGTFLFGIIYAHGQTLKLTPPDVHALALIVFKETLHYSDTAAAEGVQACINASLPGHHDTMNAILHRGIDGHAAYVSGNVAGAAENLKDILAHFAK